MGVVAVRLRVDVETANVVKIYAHHGRPLSTKRQETFRINGVIRQASVAGYAMLCHAFAGLSLQAGGPGGHWECESFARGCWRLLFQDG